MDILFILQPMDYLKDLYKDLLISAQIKSDNKRHRY